MSDSNPFENVDPEVLEWQIQEIKKALEGADRGEFATDEEVEETFRRLMSPRNRKFSVRPWRVPVAAD